MFIALQFNSFLSGEGIVALYATPNPFLLNKTCLNQQFLSDVSAPLKCHAIQKLSLAVGLEGFKDSLSKVHVNQSTPTNCAHSSF